MSPYPTQWADYDPQKFMCCLCFVIFNITKCAVDDSGQKIDICVQCWDMDTYLKENKATNENPKSIPRRKTR